MIEGMDFSIHIDPSELRSTAMVEVRPGQYDGCHWQRGSIFVAEDAFEIAEGVLERHLPAYTHFGPTELPREVGVEIVSDWRAAAARLVYVEPARAGEVLAAPRVSAGTLEEIVRSQRVAIIQLLSGLAAHCEHFYEQSDYVSVLGV